jgi:hypothetical protein
MRMADIKGTVYCGFVKRPSHHKVIVQDEETGNSIEVLIKIATNTDKFTEWVSKLPFDTVTEYPYTEKQVSFSLLRSMCHSLNKKGTFKIHRIGRSVVRLS